VIKEVKMADNNSFFDAILQDDEEESVKQDSVSKRVSKVKEETSKDWTKVAPTQAVMPSGPSPFASFGFSFSDKKTYNLVTDEDLIEREQSIRRCVQVSPTEGASSERSERVSIKRPPTSSKKTDEPSSTSPQVETPVEKSDSGKSKLGTTKMVAAPLAKEAKQSMPRIRTSKKKSAWETAIDRMNNV
jgi:hypothetical protein